MARQIAIGHHERFNGCGYPDGLAGQEIPEAARIMVAIVDAYDSLTHPRLPAGHCRGRGLNIIRRGEGRDFDPEVVCAFYATTCPNFKGNCRSKSRDEPQDAPEIGGICLPLEIASLAASG